MNLEDLVFKAGDATAPPKDPKDGIPKQWIPGWLRWPVRLFFLPFVLLDAAMQKIAHLLIRPPYKQVGQCKKRGNCCHYILIRKPKGFFGWVFTLWNTQFLGFYNRSQEDYENEGHKVLVMGCRYLKKDGSCKHHLLRPMVCRKWPVISSFGYPRRLKGCGFTAVPRSKNSPLPIIDDKYFDDQKESPSSE
ncbi:MAG: hypothetical protein KR126chlam1_01169 [Chlamydiae bacterium]|nr:hypothetical protein [Chlamydiota bacterium]